MKFSLGLSVAPCAALLLFGSLAYAQGDNQDDQPIQVAAGTHPQRMNESEAVKALRPAKTSGGSQGPSGGTFTSGLPLWTFSVKSSRDNNTYTGQAVGQSPTASGTTVVPVVVIPVKLTFQYSRTTSYIFDPTATDPGCLGNATNTALSLSEQSPIFQAYPFTLVTAGDDLAQYSDHFNRANFWKNITSLSTFHTDLGVITEKVQNVTLTASSGRTANATVLAFSGLCGSNTGNTNHGGYLGVVNINTWDPIAQNLIKSLGLNSTQFPLFVFYNAVLSQGRSSNLNNCCILGYHNALSSGQTYGVAEFEGRDQTLFGGTADVSIMSHEVNEWMQDPGGSNLTPAWGGVGQVPLNSCQNNYEVGDPLSGTLIQPVTVNGFTYHLQELAFFSWFYGGPSIGINGWFSNNGTFTIQAAKCPPGGA